MPKATPLALFTEFLRSHFSNHEPLRCDVCAEFLRAFGKFQEGPTISPDPTKDLTNEAGV